MISRHRNLWISAGVVSILLLALVILQIDWADMRKVARELRASWLIVGLVLLLIEGLVTASRLYVLAQAPTTYRACLQATAWYVLLLIGLPARLGEVAGVAAIVRYMQQRPGGAAANLFVQRIFDLLVLVLLLSGVSVVAISGSKLAISLVAIAFGLGGLICSVIYLDAILARVARPLLARRRELWPRRILRVLLQARMLRRHHLDRPTTIKLVTLTVLKWSANLAAIACVVLAVVPSVPSFTAFTLGIVYNLSAVIPLQTIGGFGISEAVLMGSFKWLGYSLAQGAPIAIAIRLALLSAPMIFWLFVSLLSRTKPLDAA